jgi:multidrug efflux pump subunit AcrA (membrane-fusion protein)
MNSGTGILDGEKEMNTQEQSVRGTAPNVAPAHTDAPHAVAPAENPGGMRTVGIFVAVALLVAIVYGLHLRSTSEKRLSIATEEAAIPSVNVVHPIAGSKADDLTLPGNVEAFTDTPIYSRTDGYLKKWYFDIGSRVRKGDLLAEIETPEIDQQLDQSRAEMERMQANADLAGVTSNRWQNCWPSTPCRNRRPTRLERTSSLHRPLLTQAEPTCAGSNSFRATNASLRPLMAS